MEITLLSFPNKLGFFKSDPKEQKQLSNLVALFCSFTAQF